MSHPEFGAKPFPQFGTDGARSSAENFTPGFNLAVGLAAGNYFANPGEKMYVTGDPRRSSPDIMQQIGVGLMAAGVHVTYLDTMPTPGLMHATLHDRDVAGGIMVTASHNSAKDNGIKIVDSEGAKLGDDVQRELKKLIVDGAPKRPGGRFGFDSSPLDRYKDFLVASAEGSDLEGVRIALDTANGAASGIAEEVFTQLGARVLPLFDSPDGLNINERCGATHTEPLQARVKTEGKGMVGAAFDGDADRLMMVDEQGRQVDGDRILYILAKTGGYNKVVATSMSNLGTERALAASNIDLIRTDVGDRYVLEGMYAEDAMVGGEQSGHIIMRKFLHAGDGMLAAIQTMRAVRESGKPLSWWYDQVPMLDQSLVNIELSDKDLLQHAYVVAFIEEVAASFGNDGRVLLRPSGTEPLVRVMVEADGADDKARQIADGLKAVLARIS